MKNAPFTVEVSKARPPRPGDPAFRFADWARKLVPDLAALIEGDPMPTTHIVADLGGDAAAPALGAALTAEMSRNGGCPSFGAYLHGHAECAGCNLRRPCESRLALHVLSEGENLLRLDQTNQEAGVDDLVSKNPVTGPRRTATRNRATGGGTPPLP